MSSMLGLGPDAPVVLDRMMTSAETLPGFEVLSTIGLVEAIVEESFPAVGFGSVGVVKGGGLDRMVEAAKNKLSQHAAGRGANAIVGVRYEIIGRELEKSVLVYGTAVKCSAVKTP